MSRAFAFALVPTLLLFGVGSALAANTVTLPSAGAWSSADAHGVCHAEARSATWTGHWNTVEWNRMSVCGCTVGVASEARFDVQAGPIWSHSHARQVCPQVCASARWTGQWTRTSRYQPGTCTLAYSGLIHGAVRVVAPGPVVVAPAPVRRAPRVARTPRRVTAPPVQVHAPRYSPPRSRPHRR